MKVFRSRWMTFLSVGMVLLIFILMIVFIVGDFHFGTDVDEVCSVTIDGEYSIDGSEWTPTIPDKMVDSNFRQLTVRGKLSKKALDDQMLVMSVDNVWFKLKIDGKVAATNYRADDGVFKDTPGYSICYVDEGIFKTDSDLELDLMYPYENLSSRHLSDFYDLYLGDISVVYELLFQHKSVTILFCILICFFGLFAFPIAGIVLGKINYRYLAFALLCFFSGIFILSQSIYSYMPLWIEDPVTAMTVCNIPTHICLISAMIYIKVNLEKPFHKVIGNIIIGAAAIVTTVSLILHFTGVSDLYAGKPFILIFTCVCAVILTACLIREINLKGLAWLTLTSWIPVLLGLLLDAINEFYAFTTIPLFEWGMALTLINQLVVLIIDLRSQYLESLKYEQMQKELYEAKVSLMVSQIQPHFLYNSLTSIAMMCTKDPKKAREATINFADYLRGNMNSLKQKTPVPFKQELEHLKKYLMLEQMRFGDLLNVEYDITTTDFLIPQLSVQPLVENAVKHGVGMKEDGGTVKIATRETDEAYEVIISDDGVGFDTSKPIEDDGRSHVGMENVRQRLKELCNADVIIESEIDVGTTATIRIPKNKEETS